MTMAVQDLLSARLLIVDEQAADTLLLHDLLQVVGYTQVSRTQDATTVCDLHRQQPFDLILLALQMPGMDGFEVLDGLKKAPPEAEPSVLVITEQPHQHERALQAGAKDFVRKPLDGVEVTTRVHNLLELRWLYQRLAHQSAHLEAEVQSRTAELRESEARYRSLTELATDWHWEQDREGRFTWVSGPVLESLGFSVDAQAADGTPVPTDDGGWDSDERQALQARITARTPFLDARLTRQRPKGAPQVYRVSGTPLFDDACNFLGYRGYGVEILD